MPDHPAWRKELHSEDEDERAYLSEWFLNNLFCPPVATNATARDTSGAGGGAGWGGWEALLDLREGRAAAERGHHWHHSRGRRRRKKNRQQQGPKGWKIKLLGRNGIPSVPC